MTQYLREKWLRLRLMRMPGMAEINYRIIRQELKLRGGKHASTRA